ncbi:hypothetical protein C7Y70_15060 [Pseudoalteromonas sp. KS88]|uniref:hypothetical protein n=1 Tax=Pseudoalteromonas sp. KS88 TaxID=2109918 RepID=UPI00107FE047|nr:hypothetical protein [Pseudoalteromonas sp. KS88]TGE80008.1 hypothetical protein C7Y70_15060 [Pseudoalteromonas sp. KS88]
MKTILPLVLGLFLLGCNSTPLRDDYTQYVNGQDTAIKSEDFRFTFVNSQEFDIRGVYIKDSSIEGSNVMYSGAAGIAGMMAQIAAHAAASSALQDGKLAQQQLKANEAVAEFITLTNGFKNEDFIGEHEPYYSDKLNHNTLYIKPIFFINENMNQVAVKAQVWINDKKTKSRKPLFKYRNLISITSKIITKEQRDSIFAGGAEELQSKFAYLLGGVIELAKSELAFEFKSNKQKIASHVININGKNKLIRAKVVERNCQFTTFKNTRNWLLRYANESIQNAQPCELEAS